MNAKEIKAGQKVQFTKTGEIFEIAKVTDTRISWYVGFSHKSGFGINTMKMTWATLNQFQRGLDNKAYILM